MKNLVKAESYDLEMRSCCGIEKFGENDESDGQRLKLYHFDTQIGK